jgi:hypothetical protein
VNSRIIVYYKVQSSGLLKWIEFTDASYYRAFCRGKGIGWQYHREDGPAVEWTEDRYREWWINGQLHREDGPAVEWSGVGRAWYLNNVRLELIPKDVLVNYMKANALTLAHLLIDPDPVIRESASKYEWKEIV